MNIQISYCDLMNTLPNINSFENSASILYSYNMIMLNFLKLPSCCRINIPKYG